MISSFTPFTGPTQDPAQDQPTVATSEQKAQKRLKTMEPSIAEDSEKMQKLHLNDSEDEGIRHCHKMGFQNRNDQISLFGSLELVSGQKDNRFVDNSNSSTTSLICTTIYNCYEYYHPN